MSEVLNFELALIFRNPPFFANGADAAAALSIRHLHSIDIPLVGRPEPEG